MIEYCLEKYPAEVSRRVGVVAVLVVQRGAGHIVVWWGSEAELGPTTSPITSRTEIITSLLSHILPRYFFSDAPSDPSSALNPH